MIKAILLDIDGTLTNSQKEITPETMKALKKAQSRGVKLAVASARTENGLARFGRWLDFQHNHGILIACNGAFVRDMESGEVLFEKYMDLEISTAILEELKKYRVIPLVAYGKYMYTNDVFSGMIKARRNDGSLYDIDIIQYEARSNVFLLCEQADMAAFFADKPLPKILVAGDPEYLAENAPKFAAPFADLAGNSFTAQYFYEFYPKGVSKAEAIHAAFDRLGILPGEMMAFGDQANDIPMLTAVKYGIAMGNATNAVKAQAFDVTLDNDHDGIAEAIYKYMPELQN